MYHLFYRLVFAVALACAFGMAPEAAAQATTSTFDIKKICPTCVVSGTGPKVCTERSSKTATLATMAGVEADGTGCIKSSYDRGVGKIPACGSYQSEKQGALCYPKCRTGYKRVFTVCWQECPSGYRDDGAFCFKPNQYARDRYPWKFGDKLGSLDAARARCAAAHPVAGCEKQGEIIYEACKSGWTKIGLDWCSPPCPSGMTDIGISCQKDKIDQGLEGVPPSVCSTGEELFIPGGQIGATKTGLCYPACYTGWKGSHTQCIYQD